MTHYLQVNDGEDSETIEVPTEEDGTLPINSLSNLYPGVSGLKYTVDGHTRIVKVSDGKLLAPAEGWGNHIYSCYYPKDSKRKADDGFDSHVSKTARTGENGDKDARWTFTDLVVLGLPWKTTDKGLHDYFSKFGELQLAQVKVDPVTGKSKGFGFVRFTDNEVQVRVMLQRHQIDGRWCDVRVPLSKDGVVKKSPCKIFVGQCTEDMTEDDLRGHFTKFGDVSDVYVPKPFRGFGFVTFVDSESAQTVCRTHHVIKDKKVVVTEAIPKGAKDKYDSKYGGGDRGDRDRDRGYRGGRGRDDDYFRDRYSGDYNRRYDEKEWRGDSRYDSWGGKSGGWSGRSASSAWQDKASPDRNLNPDLVAKVVNKAVLGVIENLKGSPASGSEAMDSGSYRDRETWWSRR